MHICSVLELLIPHTFLSMNTYLRIDANGPPKSVTSNATDLSLPTRVGRMSLSSGSKLAPDHSIFFVEASTDRGEVRRLYSKVAEQSRSQHEATIKNAWSKLSDPPKINSALDSEGGKDSMEHDISFRSSEDGRGEVVRSLHGPSKKLGETGLRDESAYWLKDYTPGATVKKSFNSNQEAGTFRMIGDWDAQVRQLKAKYPELTVKDLTFEFWKVDELLARIGSRLKLDEREVILLLKDNQST